ncbi:hypothetical protein J6590_043263 [Homalodisca vitripennis]|nr:hypothetical protein J6590_043263 [Homalodisca vitripennis]
MPAVLCGFMLAARSACEWAHGYSRPVPASQCGRTVRSEMESSHTVVTSRSTVSSDGTVSLNRDVIQGSGPEVAVLVGKVGTPSHVMAQQLSALLSAVHLAPPLPTLSTTVLWLASPFIAWQRCARLFAGNRVFALAAYQISQRSDHRLSSLSQFTRSNACFFPPSSFLLHYVTVTVYESVMVPPQSAVRASR